MPTLHIARPSYRGWTESAPTESLVLFAHALGLRHRSFNYISPTGTIVSVSRQMAVNQVLHDEEAEFLMFLDDDMTFLPADYFSLETQMIDEDLDFISGLCFKNSIPTSPCVFGFVKGCTEFSHSHCWWTFMTDYPEDQLFQAYMTGLAFTLIRKRLLVKMCERQEKEETVLDGPNGLKQYSHFHLPHPFVHNEDLAFCMKARMAGAKIMVDSRVKIGHVSKDRPIINEYIYKMHKNTPEYSFEYGRFMPDSAENSWQVVPVGGSAHVQPLR